MIEMITFETCKPIKEHASLIMKWRNDPITLEMFYHRTPKAWDSFWQEFKREYFQVNPLPVFALCDGKRIGFLKFHPVTHPLNLPNPCVDISININPELRGGGLGKRILLAAADYLYQKNIDAIFAEVRIENKASLRIFTAAGYKPLGEVEKLIEDTGEVAKVARFVKNIIDRQ